MNELYCHTKSAMALRRSIIMDLYMSTFSLSKLKQSQRLP